MNKDRMCPKCCFDVDNSGRCTNTTCAAYSCKVRDSVEEFHERISDANEAAKILSKNIAIDYGWADAVEHSVKKCINTEEYETITCPDCEGAGWTHMACYGGRPTEVGCETCSGSGEIEVEDEG